MIHLRAATTADIGPIEDLLLGCRLPTDGVRAAIDDFFVAEDGGRIVATGGLERCGGGVGLVRSFAVREDHRNLGLARELWDRVLARASGSELSELFLLTTTAQRYFERFGFASIPRDEAPGAIRSTGQFTSSCPQSAVLMVRAVAAPRSPSGSLPDPGAHARELFDSGFYCAEAVLLALAKHAGVESSVIPSIATGFCSGVSRTSGPCGAVSGAILGLNVVFGRDRAGVSVEPNYAAVRRLVSEFTAAFGSTNCRELLGCDLGTPEGQKTFRESGLRDRCREYTAVAARTAAALCAKVPRADST